MNTVLRIFMMTLLFGGCLTLTGNFEGTSPLSAAPADEPYRAENTSDGSSLMIQRNTVSLTLKEKKFSFGLSDLQSWKLSGTGLNMQLKDGTHLYFNFSNVADAQGFSRALNATK